MTISSSILWFQYGLMIRNTTVMITNGIGIILLGYSILQYNYHSKNPPADDEMHYIVILSSIFTILLAIHLIPLQSSCVGLLCSLVSIAMSASPLAKISHIIRRKSCSGYISFNQSVISSFCCGSWSLYSLVLSDFYVLIPNSIGLLLGISQIALFITYYSGEAKAKFSKSEEMIESGDGVVVGSDGLEPTESLIKSKY